MAVTRLFGIFTRLSITFDSTARFQNVTKITKRMNVSVCKQKLTHTHTHLHILSHIQM